MNPEELADGHPPTPAVRNAKGVAIRHPIPITAAQPKVGPHGWGSATGMECQSGLIMSM